jgi:LemA protein
MVGYIVAGIVVLVILWFIGVYNGLISSRMRVKNSFASIDTQLQRRFDLIPNLVETVKGYAEHEKEVFAKIADARALMQTASSPSEKADADNALSAGLRQLFAVAENYPDLKASQNFSELQTELTNTENKIAFSRQFYNDSVTKYNTSLLVFPKNIVGGMFGFKEEEFFATKDESVRENVKVEF